jgi:DNA-binding NarL/FixJ family response regulator
MTTPAPALTGKRVLVMEDEYLIADDIAAELRLAGAEVIGPAGSMPHGLRLMAHAAPIDVAIVDINLRDTLAYPLLDQLIEAGVQVIIASGYDEGMIPDRYQHLPRCEKSTSAVNVVGLAAAVCNAPVTEMPLPRLR